MTIETELNLTVAERIEDRGKVLRLILMAPDGRALPPFTAGAHVDLAVPAETASGAEPLWRQYSLCGNPARADRYELGILDDPNSRGGSRAIHALAQRGVSLRIGAPRNHFELLEEAEDTVLLGAGIGVTPLIAMAYRLRELGSRFSLHYCTRDRAATAFLEIMAEFGAHVRHHYSKGGSRFCAADLPEPAPGRHLYVCGPQRFIDPVVEAARARGHADANVHREYFNAEVDRSGDGFEIEARASGVTVRVAPGETAVKALARVGIKVEVKCEEGVCGTCITDVIEGDLDHRDHFLTDEEKETNSLIALCCSRARGKIVLEI